MKAKRRRHGTIFKSRVALEALKRQKTVQQIAADYEVHSALPKIISAMLDEMLIAIARDLNLHRPGRSEPRVKKRSPKNYRLMTNPRPEMRPLPHRKIGVENDPKPGLSLCHSGPLWP